MILLDFAAEKVHTTLSMLLSDGEKGNRSGAFARLLQELSLRSGETAPEGGPLLPKPKGAGEDDAGLLPEILPKSAETPKSGAGTTALPETGENVPGGLNAEEATEIEMLHPNIRHRLDTEQLREVIANAKSYLKEQILQVTAPKTMPTTLGRLMELAQQHGIDVRRITLEQLQPETAAQDAASRQELHARQPLLSSAESDKTAAAPKPLTSAELVETKTAKAPLPARPAAESTPLHSLLQKKHLPDTAEQGTASPSKDSPQPHAARTELRTIPGEAKPAAAEASKTSPHTATAAETDTDTGSRQVRRAESAPQQPAETKIPAGTELPKSREDAQPQQRDTKQSRSVPSRTAAISEVQTPAQRPLFDTTLEALLNSDGDETAAAETEEARDGSVDKTAAKSSAEVSHAGSAEKLELKIHEAKQMVRHLAAEVKEAVQNYKPPFTRVKIQLNPVRLGEVDVTVVQRGSNVHINISSNAAAVTTLAQNASELRTQLAQNGMGNATMHFGSSADQQQQQRRHTSKVYEALEEREHFEGLEQLEIIIPHYV
jgi:flagellar hook-length control protein FliK